MTLFNLHNQIAAKVLASLTITIMVLSLVPLSAFAQVEGETPVEEVVEVPAQEPQNEDPADQETEEQVEDNSIVESVMSFARSLQPDPDDYFCHVTGNGYNKLPLNASGGNGHYGEGNKGHEGDIIPPAGAEGAHNWDAQGQAIWNNDCKIPKPVETGTLKVCKILLDTEGTIITGSALAAEFSIDVTGPNGFDQTVDFTTTLALTDNLVTDNGDELDAMCQSYIVPVGEYLYTEEKIAAAGVWAEPRYHDFFTTNPPDTLSAFALYAVDGSSEDIDDNDGVANVGKGKTRTIAIVNQIERLPLAPVCKNGKNLLENGSFEELIADENAGYGGLWEIFDNVFGWDISSDGLEIWNGLFGGASHGEQNAELDGNESTTISQSIATVPGATYEIKFDFSPRPGRALTDNNIEALVDGTTVLTATADGTGLTENDWQTYNATFVASGATTEISFADLGISNSFGGVIDNTAVCFVSDPIDEEPEVCSLEGEIINYTENPKKFNGQPVDPTRRTLGSLQSVASYSNFGFKDGNSFNNNDFFTLGVGGYLTYKFTGKVAVDQPGPDIAIWEITGGPTNQLSNAKANVEVSQDGVTFVPAGSVVGDGTIDIAGTGLAFVQYVRITDNSLSIGNGDGGDGYDVDAITIIDGSCSDYATIVAHKIVCTDEEDLPNYGAGQGPNMTANTAIDWIGEEYPSCRLVPDWEFEWTQHQSSDPGDTLVGAAGNPWTTFGPTDTNGMTSVIVTEDQLENQNKLWFREVLQEGFIPFTHQAEGNKNTDDVTAEFYCHTDVLNYDNREFISNIKTGNTYHCVAWNVEKPKPTLCELTIFSDIQTVVEETNTLAVATYNSHPNWTASIPGATWIWELLQVLNPTADTTRTFVETFTITNPTNASLSIAADNGYQVYLNNVLVVDNLAVENNFQLGTQDIIPLTLLSGENTLKVVVKNFAQAGGTYETNPAGTLYKLIATGTDDCERTTELVTSGPVTMCKVDQNKTPLAGWTMTLLGDKVEDVVVPANSPAGVTTVASLDADTSYVALASGTWNNNRGPLNIVDAEYSTEDNWVTQMDGFTGFPTDILELSINNVLDPESQWGAYNSAHTYAQAFTQAVAGSAKFHVSDTFYGDNTGSLDVAVYEGFAGITGENGCVMFEDVPYGEYEAGEIMQDGWDYVSGAGEIEVALDNTPKTITIINEREDDDNEPKPTFYRLDGYKWNDVDGNGVQGEGEALLSGWTITISNGVDTPMSTITDQSGYYYFDVPAGEWTVSEVQQPGWVQTGTEINDDLQKSLSCTFIVGEYSYEQESSRYSEESSNQCDFGNQEEVIDIPEEETRRNNSSGTRTRGRAGQVLGASTQCIILEDYMQIAWQNRPIEVLKLQIFLNAYLDLDRKLTGVFDEVTAEDVKTFQVMFRSEVIEPWFERGIVPHNRPTGFVYKTTKWKINDILCPGTEPYPSFEGENLNSNVVIN